MPRKIIFNTLLSAVFVALCAVPAFACASCMGETDNPGIIKALMLAGGIMLMMVFTILGTVVWNIRKMERRNRLKFKDLVSDAPKQAERWPFL
jgi:hypothetical protein